MKAITTVEMTCCSCGTTFAMDETLKELRLKDGHSFYCPNGHAQNFTEAMGKKLNRANKELEEMRTELRDAKTEITRLRCALLAAHRPWWKRWSNTKAVP